ncbi:MAG: ubiquinone biosynthesis regulatory protein kinase UbiB [Gammaproteobacteria bacterium]|nr:ubiquinone biosynthesis regulatory protein kinase UbiB [Gammaproteobacteria bacterium]MBQ0840504.1 ubiquinone biosynthesis regulatory protein kinase UbiB [Gammaproteobacteria bacterium]
MLRLTRALKIVRIGLRYRLDTLASSSNPGDINRQPPPLLLRFLLWLAAFLPEPQAPRGQRLRQALEELGPVFVKFGQLLSTRPDLIPADICRELDQLQDNVPAFESAKFIAIVEGALGQSVDQLFQSFDSTPLASASIAQVHAAVLEDGREVIVKAVRPGIKITIEQDCSLMLSLARLVEKYLADGKRLRPVEVARDYRSTIIDELNLQREAGNTALLHRNFEDSPLLYIPEIYWPYTNEDVLVMERIYATPVTDVETLQAAGTDFKVLAERGVEIFFTQVFDHNFFHADMHPGNIFVDTSQPRQPKYIAIDCAIIGSLCDEDQYYLARNLLAIFRRDYRQVAELHILAGWVKPDASLSEVESAVRTVCEPIFQRPLKDISCGQLLVSLFQMARRFDAEVQPSLILLQKTLLNIEGLGRQLYPDLDLWATAHPFLERWIVQRFEPGQVFKQVKRHAPDWLEQLPHLPQLVVDSMEQVKRIDKTLNARQHQSQPPQPRQRNKALAGTLLVGFGLGSAFSALNDTGQQVTSPSLLLIAAGALLLLLS